MSKDNTNKQDPADPGTTPANAASNPESPTFEEMCKKMKINKTAAAGIMSKMKIANEKAPVSAEKFMKAWEEFLTKPVK